MRLILKYRMIRARGSAEARAGMRSGRVSPTRRDVVLRLLDEGESPCQALGDGAPKTNLSYHYARLREAGVTRTRLVGPYRMISVRVDDLDARFPGLLDAVVGAARAARTAAQAPQEAAARR